MKIYNKLLIITAIAVFGTLKQVSSDAVGDGQCVYYDICDKNPEKEDYYLNCKYDGPAVELSDETALNSLADHCPEMLAESTDEFGVVRTCCSATNIKIMSEQLAMLDGFLQRCPACNSNLKKNFCDLACHPRMSNFIVPTANFNESVLSINFHMDPMYRDDTYYSCENVYYPEMNSDVLVILCGPWGADNCSPERLFDYFGINSFSPFNITYIYTDETTDENADHEIVEVEMYNQETIPCYTNDTSMHCLCSDCMESCPPIPQAPEPPHHVMVGSIRLYTFFIILFFLAFCGIIVFMTITNRLPGDEVDDTACIKCTQQWQAKVEDFLTKSFEMLGRVVAYHPWIFLTCGSILVIVLSIGVTQLELTTDPVELWASPESRTRKEKEYFDTNFSPFYRTTQLIITSIGFDWIDKTIIEPSTQTEFNYHFGPVFNDTFMLEIMDLQLQIMALVGDPDGLNVTLNEVCIKPMAPQQDECMIQSIMNYWQNDPDQLMSMMTSDDPEEYLEFLLSCVSNPTYIGVNGYCLGTYGGPVLPYVALGGFLEEGQTLQDSPDYEESTALVITFLLNNYNDKSQILPAMAWEEAFVNFMKNYSNPSMDIAFYSERSIEDEIKRESYGDISTILISYFIMFLYIAIALGSANMDCSRCFIETKVALSLGGVSIVFLSVLSSVGFYGYTGVKATLFVIEVIPFLVLAVGVDNIFLLVQTQQRMEREVDESVEDQIARVVGKVGPSLLVATTAEALCFFLGALSDMPAVYAFALFAGMAITIDFILQITCFVALLTLDTKRIEANRLDVLCCIKGSDAKPSAKDGDICYNIFNDLYGPFILMDFSRAVILITFVGAFLTSAILTPKIKIGLEQDIAMPDDSYVLKYFDFMADYLSVGAPIYFVIKDGYNYPQVDQQNLICSSSGCSDDSMLSQIFVASLNPSVSYIASGASSWLEAYFSWLAEDGDGWAGIACCRLDADGEFIDSGLQLDYDAYSVCLSPDDFIPDTIRPKPKYFMEYLPDFLIDNPHELACSQAGHPAYGDAVNVLFSGQPYHPDVHENLTTPFPLPTTPGLGFVGNITEGPEFLPAHPLNESYVASAYYMAYHSILKTSADFTNALERAYNLTDQIQEYLRRESDNPDIEVFPYSLTYVYYEQYLTMWSTAAKSLFISFAAVFVVMLCISGFDIKTSCINIIVIIMIIVNMMACMYGWNIDLNAISVVNLVMAVGISVEFVSHISHAFARTVTGSKKQRALKALSITGSSILSGITLTKFLGIVVLGFANSQIFKIFYFRMYLLMVIMGSAHGLIFLPVLLSLIGPAPNPNFKYTASDLFEAPQQQRKSANGHDNRAMEKEERVISRF